MHTAFVSNLKNIEFNYFNIRHLGSTNPFLQDVVLYSRQLDAVHF